MKQFFEDIFNYNQLVNDKLTALVIDNEAILPERIKKICIHMQLVHQSWNARMLDLPGVTDFWQDIDLRLLPEMNHQNLAASIQIIEQFPLETFFYYANSKGAEFKNTYSEALFHIANHSSYHRGQVNAGLREAGIEPIIADFVFYRR